MADLRNHKPGYSVLNKLYETQQAVPQQTWLAKVLGVSPLSADSRPWYVGFRGEQKVGELLEPLKAEGYVVLHSVPVGKKDADIDHVVITPSDHVYVINTKHHAGKTIWAGGQVLVDGNKTEYVRNSRFEASRTEKILAVTARNYRIEPLLVFVNPGKMDRKEKMGVKAVTDSELIDFITNEEKHRPANYRLHDEKIYVPSFWATKYSDETADQEAKLSWANSLNHEVKQQSAKQKLFLTVVLVGGLALTFFLASQIGPIVVRSLT